MDSLNLTPVVDEGLGNSTYLLDLGEGRAEASRSGLSIAYAVETHLHAEFISGVAEGPAVVMCGHGERAMGGASILAGSGRTGIAVFNGGPAEWASAAGSNLETGTALTAAK